MQSIRAQLFFVVMAVNLAIGSHLFTCAGQTLSTSGRDFKPDVARALSGRARKVPAGIDRKSTADNAVTASAPLRHSRRQALAPRPAETSTHNRHQQPRRRPPARPAAATTADSLRSVKNRAATSAISPDQQDEFAAGISRAAGIRAGTPLGRVLHTSRLSIISTDGSTEQLVDQTGDLKADERTVFEAEGGAFDVAVGRSGARYEVFTAVDRRGTADAGDDTAYGVLLVGLDTNGDFVRDSVNAYDLERDFRLPSAVAVAAGTSRGGHEFVAVSSSGYYNSGDETDPDNEPSAGIVLLVRDAVTGGFDSARSRELVRVGDNQLFNANALALTPDNDLLVADFDANELRIIRDTNDDRIPDTLDPTPFYSYQYSTDAPLEVAVNSRGVVFSHSYGNDAVLLAIYDTDGDWRGDAEEVVVEGLSLDNNLIFHGLTIDREGTVYVIEDASGEADTASDGGNGGTPRIDAFPDPALNGFLRDGALFYAADDPGRDALSGLAFGLNPALGAVNRLTVVNSASFRGSATRDGLATLLGSGLTRGARGSSEAEAAARGLRVLIEGQAARILSFADSQVNIYVPPGVSAGANSIVVSVDSIVTAADDALITHANPGVFTVSQIGTGEAAALLTSGMSYQPGPFPATIGKHLSVIAMFGTGWRHALPVRVTIGGRAATVEYAGVSGGFDGLDQINVALPEGLSGTTAPVVITTADNAVSRADVFVRIR